MKRRDFLKVTSSAAGLLALNRFGLGAAPSSAPSTAAVAAPATLPRTAGMNILFLVVEDWTPAAISCYAPAAISCYGSKICKTPYTDALARSGVRFDRAYVSVPICNPSRSSLCTGLRPDSTHVYGNDDDMGKCLPAGAISLAELLKHRGAYTASISKLYHNTPMAEKQLAAFDRLEMCEKPSGYKGVSKGYKAPPGTPPSLRKGWTYTPDLELDAKLVQLKKQEKELEQKYPPGTPDRYSKVHAPFYHEYTELLGDSGEREEHMEDGRIARLAVQMLGQFAADGRQFFLSVGLHAPHTPLLAPRKYVDMYNPDDMPMPHAPHSEDKGVPDIALKFGRNYDVFCVREQTPERVRKAIASYYACSTFVDAQIGLILKGLDDASLADKTIVVLIGDHGFHLGEHGCWSKYTLFEQSTHAPLIVRVPGARANGRPCDQIVEFVDLLPTFADLWSIETPKTFEGLSMTPLLDDPGRPWKKAAFSMLPAVGNGLGRSVRTKRYRYAEWRKDKSLPGSGSKPLAVELYDLQTDPWEQINLADDPAQAGTRAELAAMLAAGYKPALPGEVTR
jgi:arylsulfatase A-like enzyme